MEIPRFKTKIQIFQSGQQCKLQSIQCNLNKSERRFQSLLN